MLSRTMLSLLTMPIALGPFWLYLFVRFLLQPEGFWQNFVLFGAGAFILGGAQLFFLIVWVVVVFMVWMDYFERRAVRRRRR